ncbi:hypothetical protein ACO0QE_003347 [Hanseniaspora vineae]
MVWNPLSSNNKKPIDDQSHAPSRSSRKLCWEKRDIYFACLDKNQILDSLDPAQQGKIKSVCKKEQQEFDYNCATSWIQYFQEKRLTEFKRTKMFEEMKENGAQLVKLD